MKLSQVHVANFRGARDVMIPLSHFVCLTGENNSGKSTLLLSLALFLTGSKPSPADYYDTGLEIAVTVTFEDIEEADWNLLTTDHAARLKTSLYQGKLLLRRKFSLDGKSELGVVEFRPKDPRFTASFFETNFKGLKGKELGVKGGQLFPELSGKIEDVKTQGALKEKIEEVAINLPDIEKGLVFSTLRTCHEL